MKIKYVGKKESETAFIIETGITWEQGSVHDISNPALCKRMLNHPDVFELVEEEQKPIEPVQTTSTEGAAGLSDATAKTGDIEVNDSTVDGGTPTEGATKLLMQTTAGVLDLAPLDKDQLHALAKEQGLSIHPNAKAETVAARLAEAFPVTAEKTTSTEGA